MLRLFLVCESSYWTNTILLFFLALQTECSQCCGRLYSFGYEYHHPAAISDSKVKQIPQDYFQLDVTVMFPGRKPSWPSPTSHLGKSCVYFTLVDDHEGACHIMTLSYLSDQKTQVSGRLPQILIWLVIVHFICLERVWKASTKQYKNR